MNEIRHLPNTLRIAIEPEIFEKFPDTKIAFLLLRTEVFRKKEQPKEMQKYLSELKQRSVQLLVERGISSHNFLETEVATVWKEVFATFQTDPETQKKHNHAPAESTKYPRNTRLLLSSILFELFL